MTIQSRPNTKKNPFIKYILKKRSWKTWSFTDRRSRRPKVTYCRSLVSFCTSANLSACLCTSDLITPTICPQLGFKMAWWLSSELEWWPTYRFTTKTIKKFSNMNILYKWYQLIVVVADPRADGWSYLISVLSFFITTVLNNPLLQVPAIHIISEVKSAQRFTVYRFEVKGK